ncbi:heavy metal translocating P-type ATPase [Puniceibacterium sediminis]|uniref:P-type Cu(2+) transporter n=1 Tax=Puniceibacterium sediminis TaxID=1608407 RepID=A0A238YDP5_9RHOB|nr:heavy metal translocating P-type ATPase [Puniceibacterium sediminis]SNR69257.1 Cu+-exporting ATPase [Puniceibacterium sediminis]
MTAPNTLNLRVDGMSCASCVGRVEKALNAVPGVSGAEVNLATETARVTHDGTVTAAVLSETLDKAGYPAREVETTIDVTEMSCASCVGRVEKALNALPGVTAAQVNLATGRATVRYVDGAVTPAEIAQTSTAAGYPATVHASGRSEDTTTARKEEEITSLRRSVLQAAALALPVFVLEMGGHMIPAFHMWVMQTIGTQTSWVIQFILTTLVLIGPGRTFYAKGIPALFKAAPDMSSLVAVGTGAAYLYSVVATFLPGLLPEAVRAVYFEAAAVIIVLILIGRWMEARAKGRTGAAIKSLLGLQAHTANVLRDGKIMELSIDDIRTGDTLVVRPGERVAVDGEVVDGESHVDESMITGEPVPVSKGPGATVTGGTINGAGGFRFRATRVGGDTTLAQIIRMVEEAQGARLPIQGLVNRITLWFVPAIMGLAALTVLAWLTFADAPALTYALVAGVSVLIIACPCAMGLATPTSIMVGTGRAAELGVLFRKGDALQALCSVDVVAVDKTGTLTEGRPELTNLVLADGFTRAEILSLVAAVEERSEHPIADAIVRAARAEAVDHSELSDFTAIAGYGVRARVAGRDVLVGADRLMAREGIDTGPLAETETALAKRGRSALFAAIDGRIAALIGVADPVKPASAAVIAALHAQGLEVAMITGDKRETAEAIAAEVDIDRVIAGVLPDGKVAAIDALRAGGRRVAFVGDGINDAPALAHADVGIAIGTGTDVAIESADVVLMSGDLRGVVNAFAVSHATMRNIRQNLFWAFGYNAALIPVAAGVFYPAFGVLLSPVLAAGAMALSSVFVLSNALRLRRIKPQMDERDQVAPRLPSRAGAVVQAE